MRTHADDDPNLARRMLLAVAATAPAGWARSEASSTTADLPPELAKAVDDYDQATVHNDVATLASLVAEDYVLVNSDSTLQNKQSYLDDFKVPGFKLDPYVLQQPVHKTWGNAALVAGLVKLSWTLHGKHESRLLRIAHVWTKSASRWRMAYTQLTLVPEQ